jgi:hypothetical protein
MLLRLILRALFVLLPCVTLQAQEIADTRAPLPPLRYGSNPDTNASFTVGLLRQGDVAFRQTAYTGDTLSVSGNVRPEAAHVGLPANVYTVVLAGDGTFYTIDANQQIAVWDGRIESLVPRHANVQLKTSEEFVLYNGAIEWAGEYHFFIGYMPLATAALYYTGTPQRLTIEPAPPPVAHCTSYGGRTVPVWHTSAAGIFTHTPFAAADLNLITNGKETNDPRFSYQWVKSSPGQATVAPINIYAPADGVLIRVRHKARNLPEFDSDDYDLFLLVACDPTRPDKTTIVRFNHITEPRPDIKAAFAFGALGAPVFTPVFNEHEERQVPVTNIVVRAGDYLGRTSGTPVAHDFDFMIAVDDVSVCPFSVLAEPARTQLLNKLGPQSASPFGPPVSGYPCEGYGGRP